MQSDRKERTGWYMYDWAVSAFTTTVGTVFLGPYLTEITKNAAGADGFVELLGIPISAGSFFPYTVSLSVILQVLILPMLGGVADYTNKKKFLLGSFAFIGSFATMALYFLQGSAFLYGGLLFLIANVAFGASMVMYNAYLIELAEPDRRDAVSSIGWGLGYLGGGILLALNLVLWSNSDMLADALDIPIEDAGSYAVRISLFSAGLWWAIFTIVPMITLKLRRPQKTKPVGANYISLGYKEIYNTFKDSLKYPGTLLFLAAYLFYNDGVQTIIVLASQFGKEELGLGEGVLVTAILIVQIVAFFGALLFNFLAKALRTKRALLISLVIWTGTVFYSYLYLNSEQGFYILAVAIAIVLGGTQALSRSLFSHLIPAGKEAEYFSLYEVSERGTSWLGPLIFGLTYQFTGSYRMAILSLAAFFIIGFMLLMKVNVKKAILEVGNKLPKDIV